MNARIVTFNVRHGEGLDGVVDIHRAASVLRALNGDLVALQELDRGTRRVDGQDQAEVLGELLGMPVVFAPTIEMDGGGEYGIGLAAADLDDVHIVDLPRRGPEEPRVCISARWRGIRVFATHLAYERAARELQMTYLAELASAESGPVVVGGDLNAGVSHLAPLLDAGLDPGAGLGSTFPADRPRRQLDFVLGGGGLRIGEAEVVRTKVSDHRPLAVGAVL